MHLNKVVELMGRFTYKPNVTFRVIPGPPDVPGGIPAFDFPRICVEMWVPDSTRPHHPKLREDYDDWLISDRDLRHVATQPEYKLDNLSVKGVYMAIDVPYSLPEDRFYTWLRDKIQQLEDHELDEWFKVDGKCLNDPHAADKASA